MLSTPSSRNAPETPCTVLLVEDEEDIRQLVCYTLCRTGWRVLCADSGEDAVASLKGNRPDLVVLDLMLPGISGFEVCQWLRQEDGLSHLPVIMLTACGEEKDVVRGFHLGADEYITKPFSPRELVARLRAVRRRAAIPENMPPLCARQEEPVLTIGSLVIAPHRHAVSVDGLAVPLTATEFSLIMMLAERPGWVYTRQQIIDRIRGENYFLTDRTVDVQIHGLRKKLDPKGSRIETVRGVGYRLRG